MGIACSSLVTVVMVLRNLMTIGKRRLSYSL